MRTLESRYLLRKTLGKGGMGKVYEAEDDRTGRICAVKILNPEAVKHPDWRSRFLTEARAMVLLRHPHVAAVYHVGEDNSQLYFAMELVEDGSAYDMVREGRVPDHALWACRTVFELLSALACTHDQGIVHRDIKPANLLITRRGVALTDFGLARLYGEAVAHRTATGERLGTKGYMAPEQQRDARSAGPSADLYSAGATLFALIARKNPADLSAVHKNLDILEPIPEPLHPVIVKAVQTRPEDRYHGARQMAAALCAARDEIAAEQGKEQLADDWMWELDRWRGGGYGPETPLPAALFSEPTEPLPVNPGDINPHDNLDPVPPPPEPSFAPMRKVVEHPVVLTLGGVALGLTVFAGVAALAM